MPGTNPAEAMRVIAGELPDFPYLPELPDRGPGADLVVQFDEPALPAVAAGNVPTASGLSRLAAVEADVLREMLAEVLASVRDYTAVHCCATSVPFGIIRAAGADAVAFDLSQLRRGEEDAVAEAAEARLGFLTGAVPAVPGQAARRTVSRQAGVSGPGGGARGRRVARAR